MAALAVAALGVAALAVAALAVAALAAAALVVAALAAAALGVAALAVAALAVAALAVAALAVAGVLRGRPAGLPLGGSGPRSRLRNADRKPKKRDFSVMTSTCCIKDTKHDKRGQRSINGVIGFRVPDEKMKDKARQYKKSGKPIHRKERTINSDFDIITQYQSEFRGFAQYYLLAYNAHQLHGLKRTMELSLAHTLANKFKTTSQ